MSEFLRRWRYVQMMFDELGELFIAMPMMENALCGITAHIAAMHTCHLKAEGVPAMERPFERPTPSCTAHQLLECYAHGFPMETI